MEVLYNIIRLDNGGSYLIADILFFGLVILVLCSIPALAGTDGDAYERNKNREWFIIP
tara:strand:- start:730 stop:903 length:174 start_codon:yes stop_codon:yes gene_type:complete